jgi:hypothetical protein
LRKEEEEEKIVSRKQTYIKIGALEAECLTKECDVDGCQFTRINNATGSIE